MTGTEAITTAMLNLGELQPGGTATSEQATAFLVLLNQVLQGLEAEGYGGVTMVYTVAAAGLTQNNLRTVTAVLTYAAPGTNNIYPIGWERAICWLLAVEIGGAIGKKQNDMALAVAMATDAKRQIAPQMASPVPQAPQGS